MEQHSIQQRRKDLIRAAGGLDIASVQRILICNDVAQNPKAKQEILAVEKKPGDWGACNNESALHAVIRALPYNHSPEQREKWLDVLKFLLGHGANPNDQYEDRNWKGSGTNATAFQMALDRGALDDLRLLKMFLDAGADPNVPKRSFIASMRSDGYTSSTPLHTAIQSSSPIECIIELINAGADVNALQVVKIDNERGHNRNSKESPLHIAAEKGSVEIMSLLLLMGADVNAEQSYLEEHYLEDVTSPTDDPRDEGFIPSVRMIPVKQTTLHTAVKSNKPDLIKLLVLYGADSSIPYKYGETDISVEELVAETVKDDVDAKEKLVNAFEPKGWSPDVHKYFPQAFKDTVNATMLAARRRSWPFNEDLMTHIFESAAELKASDKTSP